MPGQFCKAGNITLRIIIIIHRSKTAKINNGTKKGKERKYAIVIFP